MRNAANPLPFDALLVDEASMMPLAQADALLSAMQEGGRLILLGDKDQLASVDAGSVFADLCAKSSVVDGSSPFALKDCVVELKKVHRFAEGGSIAALKDAINAQDADGAWRLLSSGAPGLRLVELPEGPSKIQLEILRRELKALFDASAFKGYLKEREPEKAFALFESLRVLCSNRSGPFGVEALNELLLEFAYGRRSFETLAGTRGLPLMILRNSYSTGLNNGDVGLVQPSKSGRGDASTSAPAGPRARRQKLSSAAAAGARDGLRMSVHKAQGSVSDTPCWPAARPLDAPPHEELLYTAATRARSELTVFCSESRVQAGVLRRTERASAWPTPWAGLIRPFRELNSPPVKRERQGRSAAMSLLERTRRSPG
jgi:exodeoxyribonuclease V alpha subunit